jgi:endonuclease G
VVGTRLHYRAATEGGGSGGPVFNNEWKLIGLHHAGGGQTQAAPAGAIAPAVSSEWNEGISMLAILAALRQPDVSAQILARAGAK